VVIVRTFYRTNKVRNGTTAEIAAERQVCPEIIELGARDTHRPPSCPEHARVARTRINTRDGHLRVVGMSRRVTDEDVELTR
jgi:hypothetical protein